jgi:hypothetical protein
MESGTEMKYVHLILLYGAVAALLVEGLRA